MSSWARKCHPERSEGSRWQVETCGMSKRFFATLRMTAFCDFADLLVASANGSPTVSFRGMINSTYERTNDALKHPSVGK